jgi:pyruvate formate lyase activating enzyme
MTGKIFAIKRFAVHDGDGIRTTLFLKGCPLRCLWCHNPEGLSMPAQLAYHEQKCLSCGLCVGVCKNGAHKLLDGKHVFERSHCTGCGACAEICPGDALTLYGREVSVEEILPELIADRDFYETSGGGVTLSGGECLLQSDFCASLAKALCDEGISVDIDTSGAVPYSAIEAVLPYTDRFLYDIKAIDPELHRRCTGRSNEQILENLRRLLSDGAAAEIRIPFVPEYNKGEIPAIASFLASLPKKPTGVRVLAFHPYAGSKYVSLALSTDMPTVVPSEAELAEAREILRSHGLHVIE